MTATVLAAASRRRRCRGRASVGWPRPTRSKAAVRTSPCWSASRRSAASGGTTPIRAAPATSRRTCTRCPSRPTRTGPGPSPPSPRSATTCAGSPASTGCCPTSASAAACSRRPGTTPRSAGGSRPAPVPLTADVLIDASGPIADPSIPRPAGSGRFHRRGVPLGPLEPRPRSDRPQRRGRRHRRLGDPVRARRSSRWSRG